MTTYLGIDLGTSSSKAVIMDENQKILASASRPMDVSRPHPGWSEQEPRDWVGATTAAIDELKVNHAGLLARLGLGRRRERASPGAFDAAVLDAISRLLRAHPRRPTEDRRDHDLFRTGASHERGR